MAYGLQIDNSTGKRVVDSNYTGVYYVGKATLTSPGTVSIPGYTNSSVPPLVFLKLPTTGGQFASVSELKFQSGTSPGGAASATMTVPSNIVWAAGSYGTPSLSEAGCNALGGQFTHTGKGGCRANGTLQLKTDENVRGNSNINKGVEANSGDNYFPTTPNIRANDYSVTINADFVNGVFQTGTETIANTGFGWTVGQSEFLGNDGVYLLSGAASNHSPAYLGFHPFDTSTNNWYDNNNNHCTSCDNVDGTGLGYTDPDFIPTVTVNSLASGWTATISGNFTDTVTVYYYGIGGEQPATNSFGLVIRDSSGDPTFNSSNPPPTIRDITNMSFTDFKYASDGSISNTAVTIAANETVSFPTATTAMSSLPIAPTSDYGSSLASLFPPAGFQAVTNTWSAGLRFRTSGGNITGLFAETIKTASSVPRGTDDCTASGGIPISINIHSPTWAITSGQVDVQQLGVGVCGYSNPDSQISPTWDINHDCIFIDTTIPDALPY